MFYTGMSVNPNLFEALGSVMAGTGDEDDARAARAVRAALAQISKAGPGARVDAVNVPPSGLQVWQFRDPARAVEAQLRLLRALSAGGTFQTSVLKAKPAVKPDAESYGDFKLNAVRIAWDHEKMAERGGGALPEEARKQLAEGMERLLGKETNIWFGTDGKVFVQVTARNWAAARKLLDQYFKGGKGAGGVPAFRDVRKELPPRATVLALVDLAQYLGVVAEFVKPLTGGVLPLPPNSPAPPTGKPGYAGLAVTAESRRGSFDFFLSAAATRETYDRFAKPLLRRGEE